MCIRRNISLLIPGAVTLFVVGILISPGYARIDANDIAGFWLMEEDEDDIIRDSSGNGHDGEFAGNKPEWDNGKFGKALLFNGSSDFVRINTQLVSPEAGTIMLWLRADNPARDDQHIFYVGQGGGDGWCTQDEFHLGFRASGPLNFSDCSGGGVVDNRLWDINSVAPVKGQWHHLAATWKAKEFAKLYVDGAMRGQKVPLPEFISETWQEIVYIGKPSANKRYFEGAIDEVAILNEALDESDIKMVMNQGLEIATGANAVSSSGKLGTIWGQIKVQYSPE